MLNEQDVHGLLGDIIESPSHMVGIMEREGLRIDNLEDPMQKLAMTLYTRLVVLSVRAQEITREGQE